MKEIEDNIRDMQKEIRDLRTEVKFCNKWIRDISRAFIEGRVYESIDYDGNPRREISEP